MDINDAFEKRNVASEWVKNHIIDIAFVAVLALYIARTIATIGVADKTVLEIIADGALAFVFAISVAEMMKRKGILTGGQQPEYIATLHAYAQVIDKVTPYVDKLDDFCEEKNEKHLRTEITAILRNYSLSYEQYEKGFENPTEKQKEALDKISAIKIHRWTTRELVSEIKTKGDNYSFGLTDSDYMKRVGAMNAATTVLTAVIFGYFTLKLVDSFSWAVLVWACVQVVFFIVKGALSYTNAYIFKTNDSRNRIIYKTNILYEFLNGQTQNVENKANIVIAEEHNNGIEKN